MTKAQYNIIIQDKKVVIIDYTTKYSTGHIEMKKSLYELNMKKISKVLKDAVITSLKVEDLENDN